MSRTNILVVGANGRLGQSILMALGPEKAIAVTRSASSPLPGFEHARLSIDGTPPEGALRRCQSVINAAGRVTGSCEALVAANVHLPHALAKAAQKEGVGKLVQVSSFSVFGLASRIDARTAEAPVNIYGQTKATADRELQRYVTPEFAVESVSLPFMFSASSPGLLAPLLLLAEKLRLLPDRRKEPVRRSMLTYADAANILIECAGDMRSGRSMAADPRLFDYALLCKLFSEEAGAKIAHLKLPSIVTSATQALLPMVARRLFRSSILDATANRSGETPMSLECELRKLIRMRNHR